tara:strand:- start:227 stop:901 length:675 start_codon:yes stop_codon:yes gene_type:complete
VRKFVATLDIPFFAAVAFPPSSLAQVPLSIIKMNLQFITVVMFLSLFTCVHAKTWTDQMGRTFEGEFQETDLVTVKIKRATDRRVVSVAIEKLSLEDQRFVRQMSLEVPFEEAVEKATESKKPILCFYYNECDDEAFDEVIADYIHREGFFELTKDWKVIAVREKLEFRDPFLGKSAPNPAMVFMDSTGKDLGSFEVINERGYSMERLAGMLQRMDTKASSGGN